VETFDQACVKLRGPGYYNVKQDLRLTYDSSRLEEAVHEVFDDLLFDICSRIVDHQADVVLLAGQPTKLAYMQDLVRRYVPLPDSRIVPMFRHYAGNWYPYQDVKGHSPGLIVDPKSAVVVGAAIEFLARHGLLPQFRFNMRGAATDNSYYWGVMSESTGRIRPERLLFQPASDSTRGDGVDFTTIAQRALIGRKIAGHEDAQANPVYLLKMEVGDRIGPTEVTVRIRRQRADDENEEHLELESVSGTVAGEPAVLGENVHFQWRTLGNDRFFLDTGGLDNIELPQH
ncbi:MAG TPA: virulence factor SrfB, partial [Pirellulales bacterium]